MALGMNILSMMMFLQVVMSCLYVMHTHEHLIFPDRVAPKFVFDIARSLMIFAFTIFWL